MLELHNSSVPALELPRVLSALLDAVTVRALDLISQSGRASPLGIVWVAVGSQARREQTPASIARGALVHADGSPPDPDWVARIGTALQRCGLHPPFVARSAPAWIDVSATDELALSVLADRRLLWGTPIDPLPIATGPPRERLLAALASEAFTRSLPTGFDAGAVLGFDGRHERLNLREAAIVPIAAIARWAAAVADADGPDPRRPRAAADGSTPERLRAAADGGALTPEQAQTLTEAFELALELRIVHQMEQIAAGRPPDDVLDPATMTPLSRGHLREVFRAVSAIVRQLAP